MKLGGEIEMLELGVLLLVWITVGLSSLAIIIGSIIIILQIRKWLTRYKTRNLIMIILEKNNGGRVVKWVNIKSRTVEIDGKNFELRPQDCRMTYENEAFYPSYVFTEKV